MLLPGLRGVFNHQSFGLWPFKMLDYIHSGVLAPRALHRSLERLGFVSWNTAGIDFFCYSLKLTKKLNNTFLFLSYDKHRKEAFPSEFLL